jgi:hypothetical protein
MTWLTVTVIGGSLLGTMDPSSGSAIRPEDERAVLIAVVGDQMERLDYRRQACRLLGEDGPNAAAVGSLVAALRDEELGYWAAEALARLGPEAVAAVREARESWPESERSARRMADLALAAEGPFTALIRLLNDSEPATRMGVVRLLAQVGAVEPDRRQVATRALPAAAVREKDPAVRAGMALALFELAPQDPATVSVLTGALIFKDTRPADRRLLIQAIGLLDPGPEARKALPALLHMLEANDPETRFWAAWALGGIAGAVEVKVDRGGVEATEAVENQQVVSDLSRAARSAAAAGDPALYEIAQAAIEQIKDRIKVEKYIAKAADKSAQVIMDSAQYRKDAHESWLSVFRDPYLETPKPGRMEIVDIKAATATAEREAKRFLAQGDDIGKSMAEVARRKAKMFGIWAEYYRLHKEVKD